MQFQIGDVVVLKSGSPKMTVTSVSQKDGEVWCKWFVPGAANDGPKQDNFPAAGLVKVKVEGEDGSRPVIFGTAKIA